MGKREEVKNTCDKLAIKIVGFIDDSGLEEEECMGIMYELAASFFTCATLSQDDEASDVERVADNIYWLANSTLQAIYDFYHGNLDHINDVR